MLNGLKRDLPLEFIYCQEILAGPTTLFRLLIYYIILNVAVYKPLKERKSTTLGVVSCLFEETAIKRGKG